MGGRGGSVYDALGLDCNTDSARHTVSDLSEHIRDNPDRYLPYFKLSDVEKYLRKKYKND